MADKFDWAPLATGAASSGFGLMSGLLSSGVQNSRQRSLMRYQAALNREQMAYSMELQRANSEWMANRMYNQQVSGMKAAGLNPATANGTTPAMPALGSPSSGSGAPSAGMPSIAMDPLGGALAAMEIESIAADIKAKNIENRRNEFRLKDEENSSKYGYREEHRYTDPDTGDVIDNLDEWESMHPGKIANLEIIKHNRGQEQQRQQENEWKTQDFERDSRTASAQLQAAIASGQLKEKDVMDAFVKLPANERKTLGKMWREYDDNHDLAEYQKTLSDLQNKDFEATSFGSLVSTLKGDMGFAEKLFATLGFLANRFTNNSSFSFGFSRSHSRTSSTTPKAPTVFNINNNIPNGKK